ncbi:acyltransferase family protein [Maridesulfovibrio sp.]|uniref:acyltransferase family protein n=1 Tax=Maridesulfovibrio sp. TaxID=2795000 RepID=UPI002A1877AB|nr:acyltransferase family protein [Maridesulfovibrio sp.]
MSNRLYFLDNLRAVTIFMVVALHVSLCYMIFAPSWWFVIDPRQSIFFTYAVILIDVPIMPTMFFLAGYFALSSMQRYGLSGFWTAKFKRIIIPWIIGVLFLAPPAMYMILLSRGKSPDYMNFWAKTFWVPPMFSQSVFWFLGILTLFYMILSALYNFFPVLRSQSRRSMIPSPLLHIIFIAITTSLFLSMNQFFPADTWINDYYIFTFEPLRISIYLLYFWLGILAWKRNWFTRQGYTPRLLPWLVLSVLSAVFYTHFKFQMHTNGTELAVQASNALGFNTFAFSIAMTGISFFKKFVNSSAPVWKSFAASSYGIYLLHSLAVYYGAYYLLRFDASPFIKAPLLLVGSTLVCWIVTALLRKNRIMAGII